MHLLFPVSLLLSGSAYAEAPGISASVEQASTATPKEMATTAAEMMKDITGAVTTVEQLLKAAESDKKKNDELIKCLKEKLPQLQTTSQIAGEVNNGLKLELANSGSQLAGAKFRQLVVLHGRSQELLVAAQQCAKSTSGDPGKQVTSVSGGSDGLELDEVGVTDVGSPVSPS